MIITKIWVSTNKHSLPKDVKDTATLYYVLPKQNKVSTKNYRILGGNEIVISTVLGLFSFFVSNILFCFRVHTTIQAVYLSPVAALIPRTLVCPAAAFIPLVNSSSFSLTSGMSILLITTTCVRYKIQYLLLLQRSHSVYLLNEIVVVCIFWRYCMEYEVRKQLVRYLWIS